jgi:CBS domain-containing protein
MKGLAMAQTVNELMTHDPRTLAPDANLVEVARAMRDADVGALLVVDAGRVRGIVTDRDIVVRAIADGRDPSSTPIGDFCSTDPVTLTPDQSVDEAIRLVREHDIRRVPVVQDGRPVGIISIGDLAVDRDAESALADISAAPPNN